MGQPRRDFLGWLGGASILGGGALAPTSAGPSAASEHPAPVTDKWDMSWTERINGRFRAVFDAPEISEGAAIFRAVAWGDMYKEVYGTERSEMSPVLVLRHAAIPLVMSNDYWELDGVGKGLKLKDANGRKWATTNPVSAGSTSPTDPKAKYSLEGFLAGGGIVLACNWAFGRLVADLAKRDKLEPAAARTKALGLVIPGVVLQPNGIFAALRAQEAGCRYVMAS